MPSIEYSPIKAKHKQRTFLRTDARLSQDHLYRYELTREWDLDLPIWNWLMLNPSTAGRTRNDPTILKCIGFTERGGGGGIRVGNFFAYRTPDSKYLQIVEDPVGPENDYWLMRLAQHAKELNEPIIIACGGRAPAWRIKEVLDFPQFHRLQCLGTTDTGYPRHPLYLPYTTKLEPWSIRNLT